MVAEPATIPPFDAESPGNGDPAQSCSDRCPSVSSAVPASETLPPLPPQLADFVDAWLAHSGDTIAVAAHRGLRPHEALRLLSQPLVQQYLDLARAADNDRGIAIARRTLEAAINSTDSPVEKRRAATTLSTLCRADRATRKCRRSQSPPQTSALGTRHSALKGPSAPPAVPSSASPAPSPPPGDHALTCSPAHALTPPPAAILPAPGEVPERGAAEAEADGALSSTAAPDLSALDAPSSPSAVPSSASPSPPPSDHALTCSPAHVLTPTPAHALTPSPRPGYVPETAVRVILDALRSNDSPEPDSGLVAAHAFFAIDDDGQPAPFAHFAHAFRRDLAPLINYAGATTTPVSRSATNPPRPIARLGEWLPPDPNPPPLETATIRADIVPSAHSVLSPQSSVLRPQSSVLRFLFHLALHHPPLSQPFWLLRAIEPLDTG